MNCIIPNLLWTGNTAEARNPTLILDTGICAVVDLALEEPPPVLTRELIVCRFPIIDGGGNPLDTLRAAVTTTASLIGMQIPLLVACSGGMSRSPAVAAAALAVDRKERPDEVLANCFKGKPCDLSAALWLDLKAVLDGMVQSEESDRK